jgi:hypothetical protein
MKLVYSLYIGKDTRHNGEFCGYRSSDDLLDSLLLSSTVSSKHFVKCELYCNSGVVELLKEDGRQFPFTDIIVCFDYLDDWLQLHNWAYPKLVTYSMQKEPFIHLDSDAILGDGLPRGLLDKKLIFQQKEVIAAGKYTYYHKLYDEAKLLNLLPAITRFRPDFAMNMGLFGCMQSTALPLVKQYCDAAFEYVGQQQVVYDKVMLKHEQSMLFEQFFIVNILLENGLKEGVDFETFIDVHSKNKFYPAYRFSHFYSDWKRKNVIVVAIKKELMRLGLDKKKPAAEMILHTVNYL